MRFTIKHLKHLPVETVSGVSLGRVSDVTFETEGQLIVHYVVKPSLVSRTEYLVHRDQVVRFETTRLVVDDTVRPVEDTLHREKHRGVSPNPVAMRKEDSLTG